MRRLTWMLMLVALKAFGAVDIPKPPVRALSPDRVLEACGGQSARGCTQFREVALLCECRLEPDGWQVKGSARAVPSVYITAVSWFAHEWQHIWDFKEYLKRHVAALGKPRFDSQTACERYAKAAGDAFPETMQRIARLSSDRRDGTRSQRSEDHLVVIEAKVMPELVDDRVADLADDLPAVARNAQNRTAENRNLIGKSGKHVESALRKGNAAVDAEQFIVGRTIVQNLAVFVGRLFFDDDDHVVEQPRKLVRKLFESLFDELVELRSA